YDTGCVDRVHSAGAVGLTGQLASQPPDLVLEDVGLHLGHGQALFQLGQPSARAVRGRPAVRGQSSRALDARLGHLPVGPPPRAPRPGRAPRRPRAPTPPPPPRSWWPPPRLACSARDSLTRSWARFASSRASSSSNSSRAWSRRPPPGRRARRVAVRT